MACRRYILNVCIKQRGGTHVWFGFQLSSNWDRTLVTGTGFHSFGSLGLFSSVFLEFEMKEIFSPINWFAELETSATNTFGNAFLSVRRCLLWRKLDGKVSRTVWRRRCHCSKLWETVNWMKSEAYLTEISCIIITNKRNSMQSWKEDGIQDIVKNLLVSLFVFALLANYFTRRPYSSKCGPAVNTPRSQAAWIQTRTFSTADYNLCVFKFWVDLFKTWTARVTS